VNLLKSDPSFAKAEAISAALTPMTPEAMAQPLAELGAMRRMLEVSHGTFSLSIAVCNSVALRDWLIRRLAGDHPGIETLSFPAETNEPYGFVTSRLGSAKPDTLFLVDLDRSIPSREPFQRSVLALNAARELWERRFRCPVVFWLPEYAATLLSVNARDLWRYCSHRFSFLFHIETPAPAAADRLSGGLLAASNLPRDEKHIRIAELQQRLADADALPGSALGTHRLPWLNELGSLHYLLGNLDESLGCWTKLSELATELGSQSDVTAALGGIGLVWAARGESRKAIGYQERSLVIAREIGDRSAEGASLCNLGIGWTALGDPRKAIDLHEQALAISPRLIDRRADGQGRDVVACRASSCWEVIALGGKSRSSRMESSLASSQWV
jgi:tetratricopeptide (TPR) repeat protein